MAILILLLTFQGLLQASESRTPSPRPCTILEDACRAGGYKIDRTDKNLFQHCVTPLLVGEEVDGVNSTQEEIAACHKEKAKWRKHNGVVRREAPRRNPR